MFGGYGYTLVDDNDIFWIASSQDTCAYSGGAGFDTLNSLYHTTIDGIKI